MSVNKFKKKQRALGLYTKKVSWEIDELERDSAKTKNVFLEKKTELEKSQTELKQLRSIFSNLGGVNAHSSEAQVSVDDIVRLRAYTDQKQREHQQILTECIKIQNTYQNQNQRLRGKLATKEALKKIDAENNGKLQSVLMEKDYQNVEEAYLQRGSAMLENRNDRDNND